MAGYAALLSPLLLLLAVSPAPAEPWTDETAAGEEGLWVEAGDARGFPGELPQRTRGRGPLRFVAGATDPAVGDATDAFAIRVVDPASFSVTVEAESPVRLTLFGPAGEPLAAGPDPAEAASRSLPPRLAPQPSLIRPGVHVLVVSGGSGLYLLELTGAAGVGFLDVVLAIDEAELDRYCLGTETDGNFHCHGVDGGVVPAGDVALADFDGDGELDAAFATTGTGEANRICPGDGVGRFSFVDCSAVGAAGASSRGVAIGDLDGDLELDLVFAEAGGGQTACLGDGAFGFACQSVEAQPRQARAVALGHLDADGDLDAVFAMVGEPSRACLGDGLGGFACSEVDDDPAFPFHRDVVLGHFDGDGNLDAAFATLLGASVCLGDGAGALTCSDLAGINDGSAVTTGLLDDDALTDLVVTQVFDRPRACLGNGAGGFACAPFPAGHVFGIQTGVALADFDDDGELDAAISANPERSSLCFGDGAGGFADCTFVNDDAYRAEGVAVGALAAASVGWDDFETGDLRAWATSVP